MTTFEARFNDAEFIQKKNMEKTIQKLIENQTKISNRISILEHTIANALEALRTLSERQADHTEVIEATIKSMKLIARKIGGKTDGDS